MQFRREIFCADKVIGNCVVVIKKLALEGDHFFHENVFFLVIEAYLNYH